MLQFMQRVAERLYPIRLLFIIVALCFFSGFAYILLSGEKSFEPYLLPSLVGFGWCLCLFGIADGFHTIPQTVNDEDGFISRVNKKIKRFLCWLSSICFVICCFALIFFSVRALNLMN